MIIIKDNFISEHEINHCLNIISLGKFTKEFNGKYVISNELQLNNDIILNNIKQKLLIEARAFLNNDKVEIDWSELVLYPTFTNFDMHVDTASKETVLTSIIYLNNNFRGGETIFEDGTQISPVPGRVIFFDGKKYIHGVNMISIGNRVSFPCWYKLKN